MKLTHGQCQSCFRSCRFIRCEDGEWRKHDVRKVCAAGATRLPGSPARRASARTISPGHGYIEGAILRNGSAHDEQSGRHLFFVGLTSGGQSLALTWRYPLHLASVTLEAESGRTVLVEDASRVHEWRVAPYAAHSRPNFSMLSNKPVLNASQRGTRLRCRWLSMVTIRCSAQPLTFAGNRAQPIPGIRTNQCSRSFVLR